MPKARSGQDQAPLRARCHYLSFLVVMASASSATTRPQIFTDDAFSMCYTFVGLPPVLNMVSEIAKTLR